MRIAICDDEKRICDILAEKVAKICPEAEIITFTSGEELLAADKLPDILLLDIWMPEMSGLDVAKTLRDRDWRKILIFVTGEESQVFSSFDLHPFHFLVKPFADEKLSEVLDEQARQRIEGSGATLVARGWAIDKDGGISCWSISKHDDRRSKITSPNEFGTKLRQQKVEKKKAEEKVAEKKKEKAERKGAARAPSSISLLKMR
ncbi:MAG: response regulator [Oribacterium sp.]|nr:response regulator [Oribacterium sp.]MBO6309153.1 response regulator [Oribacterium sp.]MBP3817213.1 response regulator [Butyrivibrio sp.]